MMVSILGFPAGSLCLKTKRLYNNNKPLGAQLLLSSLLLFCFVLFCSLWLKQTRNDDPSDRQRKPDAAEWRLNDLFIAFIIYISTKLLLLLLLVFLYWPSTKKTVGNHQRRWKMGVLLTCLSPKKKIVECQHPVSGFRPVIQKFCPSIDRNPDP